MTNKGFISVFDILGFSNRVETNKISEIDQLFNSIQEKIVKQLDRKVELSDEKSGKPVKQYDFKCFQMSDTIILFVSTSDEQAKDRDLAIQFIHATNALIVNGFLTHVPLRGAMTFGEFSCKQTETQGLLVFGKALIEAYRWGQYQGWAGGILCPSFRTYIEKHIAEHKKIEHDGTMRNLVRKFLVPIQDKYRLELYALNWTGPSYHRLLNEAIIKDSFDVPPGILEKDPRVLFKYESTIRFMELPNIATEI